MDEKMEDKAEETEEEKKARKEEEEKKAKEEKEKQEEQRKIEHEKREKEREERQRQREAERRDLEPIKDAKHYEKYNTKSDLPVETIKPEDLKDIRVDCQKFARYYLGRLRRIRPHIHIEGKNKFYIML